MNSRQTQIGENSDHQSRDHEVNDQPETKPSVQRLQDHQPDAYTTGYDSFGETRVGIGTAKGDINRLIRQNEGRHQADGNHSKREAARDKKRITQSLCSSLVITPYQQQQAISAMAKMNLDHFGQQKQIEKVALCTINVVVNYDREQYFLNGKDRSEINLASIPTDQFPTKLEQQTNFSSLCDDHNLSKKDHYSIIQLVKRELKKIGYFERADQPLQ